MKPILANVYKPARVSRDSLHVQPKFNGVRALYQNGNFQSRDELPWNPGVLRHLAEPLLNLFDENVVLDGELYVHGWPLQRINGAIAINRQEPNEDTILVEYHVFDRVDFHRSFIDRFDSVASDLRNFGGPVKPAPTHKARSLHEADAYYAQYVSQGYEGLMYRLGDCRYTRPNEGRGISDRNNRIYQLLKRKDWQDDEFLILDVVEGQGKRQNMVGSFICETKSGVQFNVGSGLSDDEAIRYWDSPPLGHYAKVKFLVYTNDGRPFNPTIIAIL